MAQMNQTLPEGLSLTILRDGSDIFTQRAELLLNNAYLGLILVFVCLALFLETRLAFWVSLGIPISFLGSFIFLSATDFSINMISMFAFIVTLGIVVDDARGGGGKYLPPPAPGAQRPGRGGDRHPGSGHARGL